MGDGTASQFDVVIVGAGLAGLTAATKLQTASARVLVLEASDEVGGRTRSRVLGGQTFDLGGEFVGPHYQQIRELASSLGLTLHSSGLQWARTHWSIGSQSRVGYLPPLSRSEAFSIVRAMRRLRRLARAVPPSEPWNAADAAALDARSLHDWLTDQGVEGRAYRLIASMFEGLGTTRADRLSFLHVLWWIARLGGPVAAMRDVNAKRVSGGAQEICRQMSRRLSEPVRLLTAVRGVHQDKTGVVVESRSGEAWEAQHAIVCVPLPALAALEFDPPLDEQQRALHRDVRFGRATSVVIASKQKPDGRHGVAVGGDRLPLAWRANGGAKGLFLTEGPDAQPEEMIEQLRQVFGFDAASSHHVADWPAEPLIGGTYVVFEPGQLTRHGPHLRHAHGRVEFAAAERSSWPDSMEGAVESGGRAAELVAQSLGC